MLKRILVALFYLAAIPTAQAEMDFKCLKGSSSFLKLEKNYSYLSPEIPLSLLRQGKFNQDFIYGDEAHPITQLIRTAFHSSW